MKKLKQCTTCKEWKEFSEFHKNKSEKDGYAHQCIKCGKEYQKNNKEKLKIYLKEYYENNKDKDKIKQYKKEYREKNKDKIKQYKKEYYENNKDKVHKKQKEHYQNNKEEIAEKVKKYLNSFVLWNSSYPEQIKLYEEIRQNGEFLEVKCTYCGNWFKPLYRSLSSRLQAINGTLSGELRLYCSKNCKLECPTYDQNKYPKGFKKATSREVQPELRQMVLARDNYTCQICEKHQDELKVGLHCHHYEGIEINPVESADIDNCITLCKTCHKKVHKLPGCDMRRKKCEVD